ncbi:hypothetical protein TRVL_00584 [Trypanosoma vivax]|nr:hypothetical protein TRVL_00584 [Trypanosoma vivax]
MRGALRRCVVTHMPSHQRGTPNIAKLLYGKRKNALHKTSQAKPSTAATLIQVPMVELRQAARRVASLGELDSEVLSEVFRKCRVLNRMDRSEAIVEVADEVKLGLSPSHYCILMAHANDNKDSQTALRYWNRACKEKKANEKLHGALLAAYRSSGRWKDAVRHCMAMLHDNVNLDSHALHTVMNACRRANASDVGLAMFSTAMRSNSAPSSAVYLELLRCIQQSSLPNNWEMALTVLQTLEGTVELTAGLCNAVMATMRGAQWTRGVELFHAMKDKNVQLSKETLATLASLNPGNTSHVIQCIGEAHTLGMPVTDTMYRAVLTNLIRLGLDHEAVRFAWREYRRATEDPGNPVNSSLALSLGIVDTLLGHSRPHEAMLFFDVFESKLGGVVGAATRGIGSMGLKSQRWIVQGRVAVMDHNVVLNPRFESLLSHYDSLILPFSAVRKLVVRVREEMGTVKGRYTKQTLKRLQKLMEEHNALRVLPLVHQLNAHVYVVDGPITSQSVELLRGSLINGGDQQELGGVTTPLLIRKSGEYSFPVNTVSHSQCANRRDEVGTAMRAVTAVGKRTLDVSCTPVLQDRGRISAPERVLAVAAMLKLLNPDASIHVVSPNHVQLLVVQRWNKLRPGAPITAVRYPDDVSFKAPAEQQALMISDEKFQDKESAYQCRESLHGTRCPFVPS